MAITVVQQTNFATSVAANTIALTPTAPAAAGNLLALAIPYRATTTNGSVVTGIADTATGGSNSWLKAKSSADGAHKGQVDIWYVDPANSKSTVGTITITGTGGDTFEWLPTWYEVSGIATSPLDQAPTPGSASSTGPTVTTGVLAQAAEIAIAVIEWDSNTITETAAPSGWTNAAVHTASTPNVSGRSSYQIVAATTALTYSDTLSLAAQWKAGVVTFKASAAANPPYHRQSAYLAY